MIKYIYVSLTYHKVRKGAWNMSYKKNTSNSVSIAIAYSKAVGKYTFIY